MPVTIRANAPVLDLEIGQVVEGIELTPLLEGAQAHGYITVMSTDDAEPEPEPVPVQDVPASAPAEVEPEPEPAAQDDADE